MWYVASVILQDYIHSVCCPFSHGIMLQLLVYISVLVNNSHSYISGLLYQLLNLMQNRVLILIHQNLDD